MSEPLFGSQGIENLLHALKPSGVTGTRDWPAGFPHAATRKEYSESMRQWISRVRSGHQNMIDIEENMMIWGYIKWKDTSYYEEISMQAVIAVSRDGDVSIKDYLDNQCEGHYLRLDLHTKALGEMFKEPSPHIHIVTDGEPRFIALNNIEDDPLCVFFEFLCRNYKHTNWSEWLQSIYIQNDADLIDEYDAISVNFRDSNLKELRTTQKLEAIQRIRKVLINERRNAGKLLIPPELWNIAGPV